MGALAVAGLVVVANAVLKSGNLLVPKGIAE